MKLQQTPAVWCLRNCRDHLFRHVGSLTISAVLDSVHPNCHHKQFESATQIQISIVRTVLDCSDHRKHACACVWSSCDVVLNNKIGIIQFSRDVRMDAILLIATIT
eukprot:scpid92739/ scgid34678/ 